VNSPIINPKPARTRIIFNSSIFLTASRNCCAFFRNSSAFSFSFSSDDSVFFPSPLSESGDSTFSNSSAILSKSSAVSRIDSLGLFEYFASHGLASFAIPMRAVLNGLVYPDAYTEAEIEILKKYLLDVDIDMKTA